MTKISFVCGDKLKKEIDLWTARGCHKSRSDFIRGAIVFGIVHGATRIYQEEHPKRNKINVHLPEENAKDLYLLAGEANLDVSVVIRMYITNYITIIKERFKYGTYKF